MSPATASRNRPPLNALQMLGAVFVTASSTVFGVTTFGLAAAAGFAGKLSGTALGAATELAGGGWAEPAPAGWAEADRLQIRTRRVDTMRTLAIGSVSFLLNLKSLPRFPDQGNSELTRPFWREAA